MLSITRKRGRGRLIRQGDDRVGRARRDGRGSDRRSPDSLEDCPGGCRKDGLHGRWVGRDLGTRFSLWCYNAKKVSKTKNPCTEFSGRDTHEQI